MSENRRYTIIVKKKRIEVTEAVYHAYYQERESERYRQKLIYKNELSFDKFYEDGVNVDYLISRNHPDTSDKLIYKEKFDILNNALKSLQNDELVIIKEIFFNKKSIRKPADELSIPFMTLYDKKQRILKKLKKFFK